VIQSGYQTLSFFGTAIALKENNLFEFKEA
jgi:hypothetical protein